MNALDRNGDNLCRCISNWWKRRMGTDAPTSSRPCLERNVFQFLFPSTTNHAHVYAFALNNLFKIETSSTKCVWLKICIQKTKHEGRIRPTEWSATRFDSFEGEAFDNCCFTKIIDTSTRPTHQLSFAFSSDSLLDFPIAMQNTFSTHAELIANRFLPSVEQIAEPEDLTYRRNDDVACNSRNITLKSNRVTSQLKVRGPRVCLARVSTLSYRFPKNLTASINLRSR